MTGGDIRQTGHGRGPWRHKGPSGVQTPRPSVCSIYIMLNINTGGALAVTEALVGKFPRHFVW